MKAQTTAVAQLHFIFGVQFKLPTYLVELYKGLKNDLPAFNGDPSWTLPMPARYVIISNGTILYAEVNPEDTRRPEPEDLLPVLRQAGAPGKDQSAHRGEQNMLTKTRR